jgi:hypothetical protein
MLIPLRPRHHHAHLALFDIEAFHILPFNPVPLDPIADYQGADAVEVCAAGFEVLLAYRANHKLHIKTAPAITETARMKPVNLLTVFQSAAVKP